MSDDDITPDADPSAEPVEPSAERAEPSAPKHLPPAPPADSDSHAEAESDFTPTPNDWLDPGSGRHHRRRHTPPTGPVDRLRRKWRRWRRHRRKLAERAHWYRPRNVVLAVCLVVLILLVSFTLSAFIKLSDIRRAPLMPLVEATPSLGTNIVLLGSNGQPAALALDPNTLVVQFIHISANYQAGQVIDLPRDLVLGSGSSATTIESTYEHGGVIGVVGAIQSSMGVTVNHVIQTSFSGYAQVTDDLGGLSIKTDTGYQPFTGAQAQAYAAQQDPPGGTIETGHRYQHWSKAMLEATLTPGVLLDPFKLWSIFGHTTSNIVVDDTLNNSGLIGLIWHLKSLSPSNLHFFTVPNAGYGTFKGQHVLRPSPVNFERLSTAIRTDNLATIGLFQ